MRQNIPPAAPGTQQHATRERECTLACGPRNRHHPPSPNAPVRHRAAHVQRPLTALLLTAGCLATGPASAQHATAYDVEDGARVFSSICANCHGPDGNLIAGIDFGRGQFRRAYTDNELAGVIANGIPNTRCRRRRISTRSKSSASSRFCERTPSRGRAPRARATASAAERCSRVKASARTVIGSATSARARART